LEFQHDEVDSLLVSLERFKQPGPPADVLSTIGSRSGLLVIR
jgi:hypothetical protein